MNLLEGKIVFLTGGNGKLGITVSETLVKFGAKVASVDLAVAKDNTDNIRYYKGDVTSRMAIHNVLNEIEKEWGIPDILINNAGIDSPPSSDSKANFPFEEVPADVFEKILNVNCMGAVYCCQEIGKKMKEKGGGSIINIGSVYGILSPNHTIYDYKNMNGKKWFKPAAYSMSKSANVNLTRYLATYWAKDNIRVNMISPAGIFDYQDEKFLKGYLEKVPMRRMAQSEEIANVIAFLGSDMASYITGQNLIVDGGLSSW